MANPRQRRKTRSGAANGPSAAAKRHQKKKLVRAPTVKGPEALKDKWDGKKTVRQK
jgi:nucleolar protein 16